MNLFVYGTLLKGMERYHMIKNLNCLGPAEIKAELRNFSYFPGVVEGDGTVLGGIYELSQENI